MLSIHPLRLQQLGSDSQEWCVHRSRCWHVRRRPTSWASCRVEQTLLPRDYLTAACRPSCRVTARRVGPLSVSRLPSPLALTTCHSVFPTRQAVATHPHIQHSHLLSLLQELMRLDAARRGPGAGVGSLLGAGYASLLPAAQTAAQLPPWTRWTQRDTSIARIQVCHIALREPSRAHVWTDDGQHNFCFPAVAP
jgi:hypothetical protein